MPQPRLVLECEELKIFVVPSPICRSYKGDNIARKFPLNLCRCCPIRFDFNTFSGPLRKPRLMPESLNTNGRGRFERFRKINGDTGCPLGLGMIIGEEPEGATDPRSNR